MQRIYNSFLEACLCHLSPSFCRLPEFCCRSDAGHVLSNTSFVPVVGIPSFLELSNLSSLFKAHGDNSFLRTPPWFGLCFLTKAGSLTAGKDAWC